MNEGKYLTMQEVIELLHKQAADEKARDEQRRQNEITAREQELQPLREDFAELAHEQWSGWMRYLFSKGTFNEDGSWTMPAWAVERWQRQMKTNYADLSQSEQDSDRKEAAKFLDVVRPWLI